MNVMDLQAINEPPGTCDLCGRSGLRFVHWLAHREVEFRRPVGKCCAKKLCPNHDAEGFERDLSNRAKRRSNFPTLLGWRESMKGNDCIKLPTINATVTVFRSRFGEGFGWCIAIEDDEGEDTTKLFSEGTFTTKKEAKLSAWDALAERFDW